MQKNEEFIVNIIDNGFHGEGIAKKDDKTIFIQNAIKGEKVLIKILKVNKNIAFGKIIEIIEKSRSRAKPDCEFYEKCGGCNLRFIDYKTSLEMKKKAVEVTLKKELGEDFLVERIIGMDNPLYYRNKLIYPVGVDKENKATMGVFAERSHRIIEVSDCKIQNKKCQKIALDILDFLRKNNIPGYNEESKTGLIRHLVIRIGIKTNEIMVTLVTTDFNIPKENELIEFIVKKNPEIKTVVKNLNNKNTNVILGEKSKVIYGNGYIYDYIGDKKFKISSNSFYQVNPVQTEKLYNKAIELAKLSGKETILDLYCGIGTIGICASSKVKKLYGIETIKQAIDDAKENAKINNIENAEFYTGDVEKFLPELIKKVKTTPDVIFIDPPRKGCDITALKTIMQISPKKIVYISCNPATFARDLKILKETYTISPITLVDMFPGTSHVECVAVLELKKCQ